MLNLNFINYEDYYFEKIVLSFCLSAFCLLTVNSQIKVESTGKTLFGTMPGYSVGNNDLGNVLSMQLFGPNPNRGESSKFGFGDFGTQVNNGWNVFIGEYGTTDTDRLWLHEKKGVYLTYQNASSSGHTVAYYDVDAGNMFRFNCDVYSSGILLTSDRRLKEQSKVIEEQNIRIEELENLLASATKLKNTSQSPTGTPGLEAGSSDAVLYQNVPNPFNIRTEIKYTIPENAKDASVYVFNMQGSMLKKLPANNRQGFVTINGSELNAGMYLYALVVDGKTVDTKRMILTK